MQIREYNVPRNKTTTKRERFEKNFNLKSIYLENIKIYNKKRT